MRVERLLLLGRLTSTRMYLALRGHPTRLLSSASVSPGVGGTPNLVVCGARTGLFPGGKYTLKHGGSGTSSCGSSAASFCGSFNNAAHWSCRGGPWGTSNLSSSPAPVVGACAEKRRRRKSLLQGAPTGPGKIIRLQQQQQQLKSCSTDTPTYMLLI